MKKLFAASMTAVVAVGLALVGVAAPASAHTTGLVASSTCDAATGTWSVVWSLSVDQVPDGVEAETAVTATTPASSTLSSSNGVVKDNALWVSVFTADSAAHPGVAVRTGNWGPLTFTQTGIPGSTPQAKVTAVTDYSDNAHVTKVGTAYFGRTCEVPTQNDASAAVSVTPANCDSAAVLHLGSTSFADWGTPQYSGNTYSVIATAEGNHRFSDGTGVSTDHKSKEFTGTLDPKVTSGCSSPPYPDASASVSTTPATCSAPQSLVYGTAVNASFDASSTANGATGPSAYSVTATADDHHAFSGGQATLTFTGYLSGKTPSQSSNPAAPCYTQPPLYPTPISPAPPTFVDSCGTADDGYSLPNVSGDHFTYQVSDTTIDGVRTVTITAVPDTGYEFPPGFDATPWTHTFTDEPCIAPVLVVPNPSASECDVTSNETDLTSWVSVVLTDHVTFAIYPVGHPEAAVTLTSHITAEGAGDYIVTVDADAGYSMSDIGGTWSGTHHEWPISIADSDLCQLPTGAVFDAGASATPAVCIASGTAGYGTISLLHVPSQNSLGKVQYDIQLDGSATVQHVGSHVTKVKEAPGDYTVTASAVDSINDGINGATVFHVTVGAATTLCSVLTPSSLAFTGTSSGGPGLLLAGGMLLLGVGGLYLRRRYGRSIK